jgi:ribosomal protein L6P/L9E
VMSVKKEKLEEKFFFMFNKSFNIPNFVSIDFFILSKSTRFLILKNNSGVKKYIKIPSFVTINKSKQILNFKYTKESQTSKFFRTFLTVYQELKYKIFETIIIRGVGLKVTLMNNPSTHLELKLGYSHKILLTVPENLNVIVKKKKTFS